MNNNKDYKYKCENCKFYCNEISKWEKHIETEKHKTGKRADYKGEYKCDKCQYENKNVFAFKQHILNNHSSIEEKKKEYTYFCDLCGFGTFSENSLNIHNNSKKHQYNLTK